MLKIRFTFLFLNTYAFFSSSRKDKCSNGTSLNPGYSYTRVGVRTSLCTRVGVFVHASVCLCNFQSSFSATRSSLLHLTVSLPSQSIASHVKTVSI